MRLLYLVLGGWRLCRQNIPNEPPLWAGVQFGAWPAQVTGFRSKTITAQVSLTPQFIGTSTTTSAGHFAYNVQCRHLGPFGGWVCMGHVTLAGP